MKTHWMGTVLAVILLGLCVVPVRAEDEGRGRRRDDRDGPKLTDEQREQVKQLMDAFHADMEPLRKSLRAAREKLRELRQSGADKEAIKKQLETVKQRMEAIKARVQKLVSDMKEVLPPEVYKEWRERFEARRRQFMEEHGLGNGPRRRPRAPAEGEPE
ncbi:MAG: periplasmic heavy metal sensor [Planctomycetes bacterium]|nr:periplasmic heavy metal sensor [Planctomycetota bacterium]